MDEDDENEDDDYDDNKNGLYDGYESHIQKYGFEITPHGGLQFPDVRVVGHRGLRYYK